MTGVSLGFNNAEQGVVAPDGTPLLVVMRAGSVEVVRNWGDSTVRAGGAGKVSTAAIVAGETRVAVAWVERSGGGEPVVKAAVSDDSGLSFGPEVTLGAGVGPSLTASGDEILAVWHTGAEGESDGDIMISRLAADATEWVQAGAVDDSQAAPLWASVDARGSTLVVAWRDNRSGPYTVWTRTSNDLGATWGPEVQVTTAASGDPDVCLDGEGTVWLAYHAQGDLELRASGDGGATYSGPTRVGDGWFAHLSCDGDTVAVAWEETTAPAQAPEADKAAGWALYGKDMHLVDRGAEGAPSAVAATVVPAGQGELELVWLEEGATALSGTLHHVALPS